jgi:putative ABC transport system permease protein
MFSLNRTLSLGYLLQHPTRAVLVVLSIALGVATLLATQALNRGLKSSAHESVNPLSKFSDLLITNGQAGVPLEVADELRSARIEGVEKVWPSIYMRVLLIAEASDLTPEGKALEDKAPDKQKLDRRSVWLFGLDWSGMEGAGKEAGDNPLGAQVEKTFQLRKWGDALELAFLSSAVVGKDLAAEFETKLKTKGRRFRARASGRKPQLLQVAVASFDDKKFPLGNAALVLDIHAASALCFPESPGRVNQININVAPGADVEEVRERIVTHLKGHWAVQSRAASNNMLSDVTAGLELGFAIGGVGALVIGLFLVYNALSVSVAERRHDIGILRSVGATRRQIARLFVAEAAVLGLVGSLLGIPLGFGLAWVAVKPLANVMSEALVQIDAPRIDASPRLMLVAVLSGTAVAVLAALVPAVQAAGEEPADAVRRAPRRHGPIYLILQVGAIALLVAGGFLAVSLRERLRGWELFPRAGAYAGIVSILLGALVAAPILAAGFGRVVKPLFRGLLGLEGRLAADNLVRSPGRTGLVVAALAATGGLMVMTAGFLRSTEGGLHDWMNEKIGADLFVTSGSQVISGGQMVDMKEEFREQIQTIEGVEAVLPVRSHLVHFRGKVVYILAVDVGAFDHTTTPRALATTFAKYPELRQRGKVLVSENFSALYKVRKGEKFTVRDRDGKEIEMEVLGTVVDYTWNQGTILMDRAWYREEFRNSQVELFDVFLRPGTDAETVKAEIERRGHRDLVFVMTRAELNQGLRRVLQRVYSMAYAQQTVVGLVALLGVVSALFISVLQRRRELGLLRAVGATRSQVLRSVLAEAVLMGVIGATVGFFIGLVLEWYVLDIMLLDEVGFIFPLRVPWAGAGVVAFLAVVCATIAGLWPAYLATRLRIPEAIAYE